MLRTARWKYRTQKNRHLGTITPLCRVISSELRHVSTIGKKLVNQSMVNIQSPTAEIRRGKKKERRKKKQHENIYGLPIT